jgi:hypothetical protein
MNLGLERVSARFGAQSNGITQSDLTRATQESSASKGIGGSDREGRCELPQVEQRRLFGDCSQGQLRGAIFPAAGGLSLQWSLGVC